MQTLSLHSPAPHRAALPLHRLARLPARAIAFVLHDRDRWVPLTCTAGFVLLSLVDWLAA